MSRTVWFVAGAGAGVYVAARARRAAEALTPDGLRDRLAGLATGWSLFADEVHTHRDAKETQLREGRPLRLDGASGTGPRALHGPRSADRRPGLSQDPAHDRAHDPARRPPGRRTVHHGDSEGDED